MREQSIGPGSLIVAHGLTSPRSDRAWQRGNRVNAANVSIYFSFKILIYIMKLLCGRAAAMLRGAAREPAADQTYAYSRPTSLDFC
jgi:hypothetical protein